VGGGRRRSGAYPVLAAARLGGDRHAGARSSGAGRRPVGEGSGEFGIWGRSGADSDTGAFKIWAENATVE
jgi:hypothetical protein